MAEPRDAMDVQQLRRRFSRRSFLRSAMIVGLSTPIAGGLLAACTATPATAPTQAAAVAPTVAAAAPTAVAGAAAAVAKVAPTVAAVATQVAPTVAAAATQVAPVVSSGGSFMVSILNKQMTKDEVVAGLKSEGEVNVANWTYTANDAIVGRFQDVVKADWGVDVKCNYLPSQSPSVYLTNLYTANKAGNQSPYDVMAIEEPY